ncbi:MAG: M56 family metallopeptidase [Flavobacteriaceae bacterium]
MWVYLLKSGACLAILLLFYKLFLERESIHVFKRFYLLAALVLSLAIPAIVFTEVVVVAPVSEVFSTPTQVAQVVYPEPATLSSDSNIIDLPLVVWSLYSIGVLLFGFKFFKNLRRMNQRIRNNPKLRKRSVTNVLLNDMIAPHTFFRYIFLNKDKYEKKEIPDAVLLHEETHAQQKHSVDVLFIELLQVFLWFNPLIYFTKKAIKLNHEFLADQAVVKNGVETARYQHILLAFSSNATIPQLSNSINYSSIKKRFTVMKKRTSKKAALLRSLLVLPLFSLLLYGFSQKKILEIPSVDTQITECAVAEHLNLTLYENEIHIDGNKFNTSIDWLTYLRNKYVDNSKDQSIPKLHFILTNENSVINDIHGILTAFSGGVWKVHQESDKSLHQNHLYTINQKGVSQEALAHFNTLAKKYNAQPKATRIIPLDDLKVLETIYGRMSETQKENALPFPECLPKNKQDGASREQMAEFNKLAKHYNEMDSNQMKIMKKDVERLTYIYSLMSDEQKADAEPFPDFPEPPPAPKAPQAPKVMKGEKSDIPPPPVPKTNTTHEEASEIIHTIIEEQDPYDVVSTTTSTSRNGKPSTTSNIYVKPHDPTSQKALERQEALLARHEQMMEKRAAKLEAKMQAQEAKIEAKMQAQEVLMEREEMKLAQREIEMHKHEAQREAQEALIEQDIEKQRADSEMLREQEMELREQEMELHEQRMARPPFPPTPITPMDHIIEMAKKDALFYYEGKEISSDRAIEILKNNKNINIDTRRENGEKPIVKLST